MGSRKDLRSWLELREDSLDVAHMRPPFVSRDMDQVSVVAGEHRLAPHRDHPKMMRWRTVGAGKRHHRIALLTSDVGDRSALDVPAQQWAQIAEFATEQADPKIALSLRKSGRATGAEHEPRA